MHRLQATAHLQGLLRQGMVLPQGLLHRGITLLHPALPKHRTCLRQDLHPQAMHHLQALLLVDNTSLLQDSTSLHPDSTNLHPDSTSRLLDSTCLPAVR